MLGTGQHDDVGVILGSGPDHGRTADVYHLDEFGIAGRRISGCGRLERVQVDAYQIESAVSELGQRRHVILPVTSSEYPSVNRRVECLDASIEHLGMAGGLRDISDLEACVPESACSSPCGDQFPTHPR